MPTIDGDAHVMEGPQTWEYCDPSERKFMPVLINPGPEADRHFWLIDGKIRGHVRHVIKPGDFQALAQASGRDMVVPPEARDRAAAQHRGGIRRQVLGEHLTDRLAPPPQTTIDPAVLVLVDEPHQRCCGRSSSAPKKAAAALRISPAILVPSVVSPA